jgi:hypothetical protein
LYSIHELPNARGSGQESEMQENSEAGRLSSSFAPRLMVYAVPSKRMSGPEMVTVPSDERNVTD